MPPHPIILPRTVESLVRRSEQQDSDGLDNCIEDAHPAGAFASARRFADYGAAEVLGGSMSEQLYLVDFENVPGVDLSEISIESRVIVFTGVNQKSVPLELVSATQRFGDRLQWRRVDAAGHNALDFFIACELGRVQAAADGTSCTVLSNDKGFDPLLRYLTSVGVPCQRIGTAPPPALPKPATAPKKAAAPKAAAPKPAPKAKAVAKPKAKQAQKPAAPPTPIKRVLEILEKTEKKSRPTKRKKLAKAISSLFQEKISDADVEAIIAKLISDKKITDTEGAIAYAF